MNNNAKKWIAVLKSGEFSQDTGILKGPAGYCCLGVACELYRRETGRGEWGKAGCFLLPKHSDNSVLLPDVQNWLGLTTPEGKFQDPENPDMSLMFLNDEERYPFHEIADVIESNPAGLFKESKAP